MTVQMDQICDAVKSTVPQEMWGEIKEASRRRSSTQEALSASAQTPSMTTPNQFIDEDDEP